MLRMQNCQGVLSEKKFNSSETHDKIESDIGISSNETKTNTGSIDQSSSNPNVDCRTSLSKAYSCTHATSMSSELTSLFISPKQFHVQFSKMAVVIIDCRSQIDFSSEHIRSAFNVNCRSKLISRKLISKRIDEVEPSVASCLKLSDSVILYDQSTEQSTEDQIRSSPIYLAVQAARRSSKKVHIIQGGYQAIKCQYPQYIQINSPVFVDDEQVESVIYTPEPIDKENFVMTEILPQIYVGNAFDSQNSQRLEKFGISHVINATPDLPFAFKDDKQNLRVSIYDSPSENILQHFEPAIDFIDQVLSAPTNKVLVHCSAGISRSPTLVLAYMIKNENLTVEEALKKMRSLRSIIDPNFSFIAQLRVWEKKCRTKIDFKDDNRSINTSTINQSVQPRSRSSSQYCGSNSSNKNDGKTPIVVN